MLSLAAINYAMQSLLVSSAQQSSSRKQALVDADSDLLGGLYSYTHRCLRKLVIKSPQLVHVCTDVTDGVFSHCVISKQI